MFQVRVVRIHEPVQISRKEVYLPFIKGGLYPPGIQAAAPVGIRVYGNTAALPDSFLYDPHQDKGNHTDKKVRRDMFRCAYIKGAGLQVAFHHAELVLDLCQAIIFLDYFRAFMVNSEVTVW